MDQRDPKEPMALGEAGWGLWDLGEGAGGWLALGSESVLCSFR